MDEQKNELDLRWSHLSIDLPIEEFEQLRLGSESRSSVEMERIEEVELVIVGSYKLAVVIGSMVVVAHVESHLVASSPLVHSRLQFQY